MRLIGAHVLHTMIKVTVVSFLQRVFKDPGIHGFVIDILVLSGFITVYAAPRLRFQANPNIVSSSPSCSC